MNQVCPSIINSQGELCVSVPHFSCLYAMQWQISIQRYGPRLALQYGSYVNLLKFYGDVNVLKNYIRV